MRGRSTLPQVPANWGSFTSETIDSLSQRIEFGFRRTDDRNQRGGSAGPFVGMLCRRQIRWTATGSGVDFPASRHDSRHDTTPAELGSAGAELL